MKKLLTLWISPLLVSLLALLKVKAIEDWLIKWNEKAPLYIGLGIAGLTITTQYFTVISPFKKYEKWAKNKWYILKLEGEKLIKKYADQGINISLNIMVPKFKMFYFINPKKK